MMTALAVLLAASVIASVLAAAVCRQPSKRTAVRRAAHTENAKEAQYMHNFWNYDGGEQEEFDA